MPQPIKVNTETNAFPLIKAENVTAIIHQAVKSLNNVNKLLCIITQIIPQEG